MQNQNNKENGQLGSSKGLIWLRESFAGSQLQKLVLHDIKPKNRQAHILDLSIEAEDGAIF